MQLLQGRFLYIRRLRVICGGLLIMHTAFFLILFNNEANLGPVMHLFLKEDT